MVGSAPAATPAAAPANDAPRTNPNELLPGGECTTTLVRRGRSYVLKTIKDETCRGCSICRPEVGVE